MPAIQRGQPYEIRKSVWGIRYRDRDHHRVRSGPIAANKTGALKYYRDVIAPTLAPGYRPPAQDHGAKTFSELVEIYLERHGAEVRSRTISTLRERLSYAQRRFGTVTLRELEGMVDEIAGWAAAQPPGARYGRMQALRQCLEAAMRWGYVGRNPAKATGRNRQPPPRTIRVYTHDELLVICTHLPEPYKTLPVFAAATGLRPEEWQAIEHRDIDRSAGVLRVRATVSDGELVELGKTTRSRRQVPLSPNAISALDGLPTRVDTPLLFAATRGGVLNTSNFANRFWRPAIISSGVDRPARVYDLRSTFASNALAAGVSLFELAKIMGTSALMIERAYGSLLEDSAAGIASRLAVFEARTS